MKRRGKICKRRGGCFAFSIHRFVDNQKKPALVVATLKGENVILAQITTKQRDDEYALPLTKTDFASGVLKADSIIMPSILFTAESSTVNYKAGKIKPEKIEEVEKKIVEIFTR